MYWLKQFKIILYWYNLVQWFFLVQCSTLADRIFLNRTGLDQNNKIRWPVVQPPLYFFHGTITLSKWPFRRPFYNFVKKGSLSPEKKSLTAQICFYDYLHLSQYGSYRIYKKAILFKSTKLAHKSTSQCPNTSYCSHFDLHW